MGMIFLYIHIPHILHILSTQSSQTNHFRRLPCSLSVSIFLVGSYIPCWFLSGVFILVLVSVFDGSSVISRYPVVVPLRGIAFPLVSSCRFSSCRASRPGLGVSFRFPVSFFVSLAPLSRFISYCWAVRRFSQLVFSYRLVSSVAGVLGSGGVVLSSRPSSRVGALLTVRSFVVLSVVPSCVSGFMPSRRSSRFISSCGASRCHPSRGASFANCIRPVVCHRLVGRDCLPSRGRRRGAFK